MASSELARKRDRLIARRKDAVRSRRRLLERAEALRHRIKGLSPRIRKLRKRIARKVDGIDLAGLGFIARMEGEILHGYNDSAGHCTIGVGHLLHLGNCSAAELSRQITHDDAMQMLRQDAQVAVDAVLAGVKVPLTQSQANALFSFTFNVGTGAFASSTLLARLNNGEYAAVRGELSKWVRAGGVVVQGLVTRREAEAALFNR